MVIHLKLYQKHISFTLIYSAHTTCFTYTCFMNTLILILIECIHILTVHTTQQCIYQTNIDCRCITLFILLVSDETCMSMCCQLYFIITLIKCTTYCKTVNVWNIYFKDQVQVYIGRAVLLSHHHNLKLIHYELIQRIYTSLRKCCQLEMTSTLLCSFRPHKSNWYIRNMYIGASKVQAQEYDVGSVVE